jgi:hypothetical protein
LKRKSKAKGYNYALLTLWVSMHRNVNLPFALSLVRKKKTSFLLGVGKEAKGFKYV